MRKLTLWIVLSVLAVPGVSDASSCKKVMAKVKELGSVQAASGSRVAKLEARAARLEAWIEANVATCNLASTARRNAWLAPYVSLSERDPAGATKGLVRLEIGIRSVIPEDMVCIVATRKNKAARRGNKCFTTQDKGASTANLKGMARGWCQARKAGTSSRNLGIETNKLAELFTWPSAPPDFPERVLDHWASITCPETL